MISLFAYPWVLPMTSVPCYVFISGNLSTTSLTTVTFRLTHAMTFKILTDDTLKVIHQSNVRSALNPHAKNLRLDPLEPGDVATPIVKSRHDSADDGEILPPMPVIDPSELIGRTFLMDKEDGQRHRARILNVIDEEEICKRIGEHERELFRQPGHVQFVCSVNDDDYEEILSYNELMDYIEKDEQQHQDKDGNGFWNFKHIVGHHCHHLQHHHVGHTLLQECCLGYQSCANTPTDSSG